MDRLIGGVSGPIYSAMRCVVGLMFMQHGAQKLFGLFGGMGESGATAPFLSLAIAAPLRADKSLGMRDYPGQSGTKRDKTPVFAVVLGRRRGQMGIKTFVPRFSPIRRFSRGLGTVLTPGKACLKGLAALTTNTTQATIQAQMKPSSSWWRGAEPSRSASRAVGAVCANVQTPRCSRSADGWWPLGVREQV